MEYILVFLFEIFFSLFPIAFIIIIAIAISRSAKKKKTTHKVLTPDMDINFTSYNNVSSESTVISEIKDVNPNFSTDNFKHFAEMVYMQYLGSINQRDFSIIEKYLSETLSKTHKSYIDSIITAQRNINIENINVKKITFSDFSIINNVETIKIALQSSMNKYETNDAGQILNGYRSRIVSPTDVLTFQRNPNKLFKGNSLKCPNCMGILKSIGDRCEYCGTLVKFEDDDSESWELVDVQTL
jgi:hypothetical protein